MQQKISVAEIGNCIGQNLGHSDWFVVDQDRINSFADCTDDHQFIHVDADAAAKTPFGTTIAHGFLTLSLLTSLCANLLLKIDGMAIVLNYGFDKVRFLSPVKTGSEVRAVVKLLAAEVQDGGRVLSSYEVTVEIKGEDKPALIAVWLGMSIVGAT